MAYTPTNWQDLPNTSTPITAASLNNMEAGIVAAYVKGAGGLVNADIAAGAAIAYSKLALTGAILNGDLAGSIALAKLVDPGSGFVIGSTGSGALAVRPPGFELNYTQITTPPGSPGGVGTGSAVTCIAPGALTFDGGSYMFHFFAPTCSPIGGNSLVFELHDGTNFLGILATVQQGGIPVNGFVRFAPTSGSHTYTVKLYNLGASPLNINCGAGGANTLDPAFLRITKV